MTQLTRSILETVLVRINSPEGLPASYFDELPSTSPVDILNPPVLMKTLTREEYLSVVSYDYNLKHEILYSLFEGVEVLQKFKHRADLIDMVYSVMSACIGRDVRVVSHEGNVVSVIVGRLSGTGPITSYSKWGLPEDAPIMLERGLTSDPLMEAKDVVTSSKACPANERHNVQALLVISKGYLRFNSLELVGNKLYKLLNPKAGDIFSDTDGHTQNMRLCDILRSCQGSPYVSGLSGRSDLLVKLDTTYNSKTLNRNSNSVFVDSKALQNYSDGYIRIEVTEDPDSVGAQLGQFLAKSYSDVLLRSTSVMDLERAKKTARYDVISGRGCPDFIGMISKNSVDKGIRLATENTRIFRTDVRRFIAAPVFGMIFQGEMNLTNLLRPNTDINKQVQTPGWSHASDFEAAIDRYSEVLETASEATGFSDRYQLIKHVLSEQAEIRKAEIKSGLTALVSSHFSQGKRLDVFHRIWSFWKRRDGSDHNPLATCYNLLEPMPLYDDLVSYGTKGFTLDLSKLLAIFATTGQYGESRYSRYSRDTSSVVFGKSVDFLTNFYLDNFIPRLDLEETLSRMEVDTGNTNPCVHVSNVARKDIELPVEELISISDDATNLVRTLYAAKTYGDLKVWWETAKVYLEKETLPRMLTRCRPKNYTAAKMYLFIELLSIFIDTLAEQESLHGGS